MGNPKEKSTQGALEEFQQAVASLFDVWESHVDTNDDQPQVPVFLDLLAGPNYPLSQAFQWAGWKVVQPIDYQIDNDFDITNPSVQHAVSRILPQCHLVSAAMDCSTKSRIREIRLPGAQGRDLHRVVQDNKASDFQLAVQHVMHEKGRGAIRENPARSLHWEDPNEKWVCENGDWHDYHYDSCCFNAVRRKAQKLRHNMIELCALPSLQCAHWHDPAEWRPYTDQAGVRVYPSREEAEYSAALVFTIAAAVSHWAVNQGFAVQKVTRLPAIECAGDRRAWLGWGPRTFREYAMGPTALQLGFRPGGQELASLPTRVHIADVLDDSHQLPADVVYAGHGHFSHRLSPTIWENPFRVGRDGTHVDTLFHYINHFPSSPLVDKLDTLDGMRLACDCPLDHPCHVDVLIGTRMMQIHRHSRTSRKRRFPRQLLLMAGVRVVRAMPLPLNQVSAYQLIQWQFPCVDFSHVRWPLLEDVLTQPMFRSFQDWVHQQGLPADGPLGSNVLPRNGIAAFRAGMTEQAGAAGKRLALPPVVPFNLTSEQHFAAALAVQRNGCPLDYPSPVDRDLQYASWRMVESYSTLTQLRGAALWCVRCLAERLQGITDHIRAQQAATLRMVNPPKCILR